MHSHQLPSCLAKLRQLALNVTLCARIPSTEYCLLYYWCPMVRPSVRSFVRPSVRPCHCPSKFCGSFGLQLTAPSLLASLHSSVLQASGVCCEPMLCFRYCTGSWRPEYVYSRNLRSPQLARQAGRSTWNEHQWHSNQHRKRLAILQAMCGALLDANVSGRLHGSAL